MNEVMTATSNVVWGLAFGFMPFIVYLMSRKPRPYIKRNRKYWVNRKLHIKNINWVPVGR